MRKIDVIFVCLFCILASCSTLNLEDEQVMDESKNSESLSRGLGVFRDLTPEEMEEIGGIFPYFSVPRDEIGVTDEATYAYNCIAYAMGRDDIWINPSLKIKDFERDFIDAYWNGISRYTFEVLSAISDFADVDGWGHYDRMAHASIWNRVYDIHESKLGSSIRVTHTRLAFDAPSSFYGMLQTNFIITSYLKKMKESNVVKTNIVKEYLSAQEYDFIDAEARKVSVNRENFNSLFEKWKKNWLTNPQTKFSSDTRDCKILPEFSEMIKMGPQIIPLLMEKLKDSENNFIGLVLYDELQTDKTLKITYSVEDSNIFEGEQQRAVRTCKKWIKKLNCRIDN